MSTMSRGAELLRLHRRLWRMTQAELGKRLGDRPWRHQQVCAWETGRTRPRRRARQLLEELSRGFVRADAWTEPAHAIPAAAQTDLVEMITASEGAR